MTETDPPAAQTPTRVDPTRVDYVALPAGTMVGRYEILGVLGQGGFGITYLARDSQLDREVALKEYLPATLAVRHEGSSVLPRSTEVADDFGWGRTRFIEEGRTLASLHEAPAIVQVFDFLEANGTAYIVMELLRGETLEHRIKAAGPLDAAQLEAILWPLLTGLQKVHDAGFLHRDIKPANIMLGAEDRSTLIDFGASRVAMADRTKTMTAIFTPGYAAPEQFTAAKQGVWTDIYGLAATLYYAITGKAPPSAFDRLMEDTYEPLTVLQPEGFSRGIMVGIDAGLAIHFDQRPQTIAGWRALLQDEPIAGETTVVMTPPSATVTPPSPPTPPTPPTPPSKPTVYAIPPRRPARNRWLAPLLGFVLLATAAGYYVFAPGISPVATSTLPQVATPAQPQVVTPAPPPEPPAATPAPAPAPAPSQEAARPAQPAAPARPPNGEVEEAALKLTLADRQRAQAALTALGFDTKGSDGSFGPRTREMITAWQRARKQPTTGYLTAAQHQALLRDVPQKSAASAPAAAPPQAAALPDEEAALAVEPPPVEPPPVEPPMVEPPLVASPPLAPVAPSVVITAYGGSLSGSSTGGVAASLAPIEADLRHEGRQLTGRLVHTQCGSLPLSLTVDAAGAISGNLRLYESGGGCATNAASASGRVTGTTLALDLRAADVSFHGTLSSRTAPAASGPGSGLRSTVP